MASGTLQSAGIARHTIWAARLVVLAVFLDLFVQFPTIAPFAEGLGASAALVGIIVAAYSVTNLFGNLGRGIRTRQVGPPATDCRRPDDHDLQVVVSACKAGTIRDKLLWWFTVHNTALRT